MELKSVEEMDGIKVFAFSGYVGRGSEGNADCVTGALAIQESGGSKLLLDLRGIDYEFGDGIGALWVPALAAGRKVAIVAEGGTKAALESLIEQSIPVPVFAHLEAARNALLHLQD